MLTKMIVKLMGGRWWQDTNRTLTEHDRTIKRTNGQRPQINRTLEFVVLIIRKPLRTDAPGGFIYLQGFKG